MKDRTKFEHRNNIVCFSHCPNVTCNETCVGETDKRTKELKWIIIKGTKVHIY